MLKRGVVVAVSVAKKHSKFFCIVFFVFNILFSLHVHFNALLKLQLNWEFPILLFSGL